MTRTVLPIIFAVAPASFNLSDDGSFNGTADGTLITDPPVASKLPAHILALLGSYMSSAFAPLGGGGAFAPLGGGGAFAPLPEAPSHQILALPHA